LKCYKRNSAYQIIWRFYEVFIFWRPGTGAVHLSRLSVTRIWSSDRAYVSVRWIWKLCQVLVFWKTRHRCCAPILAVTSQVLSKFGTKKNWFVSVDLKKSQGIKTFEFN
jgi:hypothetical protein